MYEQRTGQAVDGVVSVDPIALSHVLVGTGPVQTVGGQTLTTDNVVPLLLSTVYAEIPDTSRQNDFYNAVARDVFKAVSSGAGNPRAVLENIATSASERRLLVWSARPDEQKLLAPTALAGRLETGATENPQVGVYFNAALPYKLDYYLDYDTSVSSTRCVNGRQQLTVTVDLASRVPAGLPEADAVRRTGRAAVQAGHDRDDDVLLRSGRRDDGSPDRGRGATRSSPCSGWTAGPSSPGP